MGRRLQTEASESLVPLRGAALGGRSCFQPVCSVFAAWRRHSLSPSSSGPVNSRLCPPPPSPLGRSGSSARRRGLQSGLCLGWSLKVASGGACVLPEQTCLPPSPALIFFTLSLCFSRSPWCSEEGRFSSSRPNLGYRAPSCARALGGRPGLAGAWGRPCFQLEAPRWSRVLEGPRAPPPPSHPPSWEGGPASSQAPWRWGPLSPQKAGCLVGREDCVPHNLPRGALPQAVALVPVPPPSPLRPWPTGWSARVRTSPGSPRPRPSPHPPTLLRDSISVYTQQGNVFREEPGCTS